MRTTPSSPDPRAPVLGVWGYSADAPQVEHHDSGAALVADGRVLSAVNEERITRRKNEGRWPIESIRAVIEQSGLSTREIRSVALAGLPPLRRAGAMIAQLASLFRETGILLPNRFLYALLTAKKLRRTGPREFSAPLSFHGHHDAHAASAAFTAPFEDGCVVTLDGIGDSAHCGAVYDARGGRLVRIRTFNGYASVGLLYSAVTKAFGYRPARHEGKITGLAAHGDPERLIGEFRRRLRYENRRLVSDFVPNLFRSRVDADWATGWIDEMLDRESREDIAAALQRHTEEIGAAIARDALADTGQENIALAGGVFANVRVNQAIRSVARGAVWIHPNMGDGGLGLGAALRLLGRRIPLPDVYLGHEPGPLPASLIREGGFETARPASMEHACAAALARGLIVGRCGGRMEYGPRALGHRTIFVSADDAAINDTLNARLRRTEFMPFAPIMTERAASLFLKDWSPSDGPSRFMTMTYDVTDECRKAAPAIVHVDGTARPQVVHPDSGFPEELLVEYGRLTGKEILINTSFNIHEEPIVRSAEDAVRSLRQGAVELLSVEDQVVAPREILSSLPL